ncbi:unnamed protein product [Angiostrongylus costaricensis]|uniref:C2H2-type domain-containing protein n=1 Tax=Angiostrongylus costaricensis TaxID=334426 RepID=A0A0R3PZP8_ANGCS|nr:unnamed protein product [Angiostrongylus costaricensis]
MNSGEIMKEEFADEAYSWATKTSYATDTEQSLLVANRIKQEWGFICLTISGYRHQPIVFDHFICMRIGLNTENNVQKLMALLAAHNFVDLTVIQVWTDFTIQNNNNAVWNSIESTLFWCYNSVNGSNSPECIIDLCLSYCFFYYPVFFHFRFNTVLSHVQKVHLKMAAFQCRICKHYRTTHERIQSHVTTVHKARSNKFDSSLAGPISANDMQLMERMISICFPGVRVKLEITDRLCIRTFEYNGVKT